RGAHQRATRDTAPYTSFVPNSRLASGMRSSLPCMRSSSSWFIGKGSKPNACIPHARSRALSVAPVLRYGTVMSDGSSALALSRIAANIGDAKSDAGASFPRDVIARSTSESFTTFFNRMTTRPVRRHRHRVRYLLCILYRDVQPLASHDADPSTFVERELRLDQLGMVGDQPPHSPLATLLLVGVGDEDHVARQHAAPVD